MENKTDNIQVTEEDIGVWFSIDGEAIKNPEQLDLAIIALSGVYGFTPVPLGTLQGINKFVHSVERVENDALIIGLHEAAEKSIQYLNTQLDNGLLFDIIGEDFDQFGLFRLAV